MNISSDNKPTNKPHRSVPLLFHLLELPTCLAELPASCKSVYLSPALCGALFPRLGWHPIPASVGCCLLPLFTLCPHPFRLLHWLLYLLLTCCYSLGLSVPNIPWTSSFISVSGICSNDVYFKRHLSEVQNHVSSCFL